MPWSGVVVSKDGVVNDRRSHIGLWSLCFGLCAEQSTKNKGQRPKTGESVSMQSRKPYGIETTPPWSAFFCERNVRNSVCQRTF